MTRNAVKFAKHLCKAYRAKLILRRKRNVAGAEAYVDFDTRTITVFTDNGTKPNKKFLSDLFHELAHLYCEERGIYPAYNRNEESSAAYYKKYAYKAEATTDKVAKKLMGCFLPDLKYEAAYLGNKKETTEFLKQDLEF